MKIPRSVGAGLLVLGGMVLLVALTYLLPFVLLNRTGGGSSDPGTPEPVATMTGSVPPDADPDATPGDEPPAGPEIVISPFTQRVTSSGRPELEISADEARIDQKKRVFILHEIRDLRFFGNNSEVIRITARRGSWNQQTNKVQLSDTIHGIITQPDREPVTVDCQWLEYDPDTETIVGGSDVMIRRLHVTARGDSLIIRPGLNHIELAGNVVSTIDREAFGDDPFLSEPVQVTCGVMFYNGENRILQCDKQPKVVSGRNEIQTDSIRVDLGNANTRVQLTGGCRVVAYPPPEKNTEPSVRADIRARSILLDMNAGTLELNEDIDFGHGTRRLTASDRALVAFDPDSQRFSAGRPRALSHLKTRVSGAGPTFCHGIQSPGSSC
ncbi:MAG TPA: LPS export ABC transporter periplasmic protein LptC [bacterium]|nr:LPS export ABC transporter periplasmic protein LptC [bacterium]